METRDSGPQLHSPLSVSRDLTSQTRDLTSQTRDLTSQNTWSHFTKHVISFSNHVLLDPHKCANVSISCQRAWWWCLSSSSINVPAKTSETTRPIVHKSTKFIHNKSQLALIPAIRRELAGTARLDLRWESITKCLLLFCFDEFITRELWLYSSYGCFVSTIFVIRIEVEFDRMQFSWWLLICAHTFLVYHHDYH